MSQRERILDWLRQRGREGVHSFELYSERMPRAAAVIHQLRKDGYVIESVQGVFRGDAKGVWYFLRGEPEGQLELERRAGVGGGTTTSSSDYSAASHSGTDERQLDLALPHADTPQAGRPGHFDDWDVAA